MVPHHQPPQRASFAGAGAAPEQRLPGRTWRACRLASWFAVAPVCSRPGKAAAGAMARGCERVHGRRRRCLRRRDLPIRPLHGRVGAALCGHGNRHCSWATPYVAGGRRVLLLVLALSSPRPLGLGLGDDDDDGSHTCTTRPLPLRRLRPSSCCPCHQCQCQSQLAAAGRRPS